MPSPQQIPQRFGAFASPLGYEVVSRLQQMFLDAFRHGRTSCGTIQASARIEMTNPVARIQGTSNVQIIETPLFGAPLCIYAVDGFSFVTGGNIGVAVDVPAGTGAVLQYDEARELWFVYGGLRKALVAGSGITLTETKSSISIQASALHTNNVSASSSKTNFTSPVLFSIAPTIPAGLLNTLGAILKIRVGGTYKAQAGVTYKLFIALAQGAGSADMCSVSATTAGAVANAQSWYIDCWVKATTTGASGVLTSIPSSYGFDDCASGCCVCTSAGVARSFSCDLTAAIDINVSVLCSAASTDNTITMLDASFETALPLVLYS